ncbi:uncharacterized protein LOC132278546 [Cornus florida]|uniref:uncharacterized protein LOC132278546 n=1 Tax=Cornus florida TaxID=4283 RepID=UPI0028A2C944|nr:uncharacterized protein LOC132278546 [Cornus florida]
MMESAIPTLSPPYDEDEVLFNEVEMEVADILLDFPILIAKLEARMRWGTKRRRSVLDSPPSPSLPRPPQRTERGPKFVVETSSTATFLHGESGERPQHSHKNVSKKRSREELLGIINESTQRKQCLTESVEKVKRHYEELLATNLTLKQQLNFWRERGQPQNLELEIGHGQIPYQQSFIVNRTMYGGPRLVVPHVIPNNNNNVSANDSLVPQPFDLMTRFVMMGNRAKAAEARKHRMIRMRGMKLCFKKFVI